ncbi:flavonoid 3',5'-hydroxylase-like [Triticum aestivum]|uniref:flavonoid 3',5'-hydroxylase-like n=1 Tax=Triticum aestivum TaxID=4565 RepID=UPI001D01599C|nr:flavonoid 3',5'-hydroxylase-like [Triticum aestivum]
MTVSLLTGTGQFNISDLVSTLSWLDLQGVQAKLRRVHRQFDGLITKLLVEHPAMAEEHAWEEGRLDFVDRLRLVAWSRPGRGGQLEPRAEAKRG